MKHNSLISANGFHNPLASTTIKSCFLTAIFKPLLLLFLLVMGSSVVWAWNVRGEGLPGLNTCTGCGNWDSNIVEMAGIGNNTYCATFLNVAAESGTRYRLKICDGWMGADKLDNSKSNVNFVDAGDNRISFTIPFLSNVFVFYNTSSEKIWVIAVPVNASNYSGSNYIRQDLGLNASGWLSKDNGAVKLTSSSAYAKHVAAFVIPKGMQWRFEIYNSGGTKKVDKTTVPADGSATRLAFVVWDGSSSSASVTLMPYVIKKSGWKLYVDDVDQGTVDANGDITVSNMPAASHTFYFTNGEGNTYHGINYFGGCYVNATVSSSLFSNHQYYKTSAVGTFTVPTIDTKGEGSNADYYMFPKGKFTLTGGAKDVTFNFDGGVITINAVDHADVGPKYNVTLHPNNGGSYIVRENVPEGSNSSAAALNLAAVTYGVGTATWYTNPECTTPFSTVTGNMDLYAKWGVSGNYYVVGDLWMYNSNGDWDNNKGQLMTNTNGVCTVTYTAPKGLNRIEIIKDKDWYQKINGGSYSAVLNASSPISLSVNSGHIAFTLAEAKRVTITFDGKVSVSATDYTFDQSVSWRVKTSDSGWGNNPNSWDHSNVMTKTASGASIIIQNVPANTNHSFMITRGSDEQAAVGTYNFNALWLDTSNPSSGLTWNMQNTNIGDRQLAQTDNEWRNCSFRLSAQSDIRITFDGGKIRCDIVAPNTVTFNSNGGSAVASQEVSNGGTASEPSAPTKDGYTFVKWQLNGSDYNFSNPVTGNITLDAVWAYKAIESVSLNESTHMTWVGNTDFTLTPTYDPSDLITKTVAWSSDNTSVATVSNGTVHAEGAGSATITCTVTDQFDHQETATCEVTVAACEMATDNIYSMTVTGYNSSTGSSATLSGLWNESSDNDGPASLTMYYLTITPNTGGKRYLYADESDHYVKRNISSSSADNYYWIKEKVGKTGNNLDIYTIKNYGTGLYLASDDDTPITQNWYAHRAIVQADGTSNVAKWHYIDGCGAKLMNVAFSNGDNSYTTHETFLHVDLELGYGTINYHMDDESIVAVGSSDGCQNRQAHRPVFEGERVIDNPNYKASLMNGSYYRMNTNATVQANLGGALVPGAVITVLLYADAATTVKLQKTDGTEIETINLTADTEREYTYTGSALVGESAFVIKATDNHAGIASIVVAHTYAAHPSSPALAWETDLTGGVIRSVTGGSFRYVASSAEGSLGAVTYTSSDGTVATVASDGTVTPLTDGTTTITATIEANGCYSEQSITYSLTLSAATLAELINATEAGGTLTLTGNYAEDAVIDKAITINGQGHTIGNLTVEQTGDLTLGSALTVNDFTICAKAGNTSISAASGQVRNANNLTVSGNAYFLYTVDPSGRVQYGWYDFTVPFPVNAASGIKGIQGGVLKENFAYGPDYAIMDYNGAKQAQGQYPYKKFSGIMQPNKLYSITLDDDYNYNTLRMQKTTEGGALVASDNVTLNAYPGDGIHDNWNGVGNGTLHHADADNLSSGYVQVYQSGSKTFLPVNKNDYSFVVGTAFMVQETGTMTFSQATHGALLAPSRYESAPATAIQIAGEGQPFSDQLFITASETGGQAYTPGTDLAKAGTLGSANVPQIWTTAYNNPLCVHEAQLINGEAQYNLSLYAPAAGSYTLTSLNIPADYSLYLTQDGTMLGELNGKYTLDLNKGITTKYGLLLVETYKTPTGIEEIGSRKSEIRKIMHNGVLYILHNGKVYNAQGAKVK